MSAPSDLEATLLELCAIASPTGEEAALCDHVEAELRGLYGDSVQRDGHSLVVLPPASSTGPSVVFAGHFDVVRTSHDGAPRIDGERLYGPGASDMKSGLAVMLHLLRELPTRSAALRPLFVFYEREEGPFDENRLGPLLDRFEALRRADFAVCLEPSTNVLQLGCMGSLHARALFSGRTAHSARPWQGENAIHKAWPLLRRLEERAPVEHRFGDLLYREVVSATLAQGGRGRNVVPDRFELNLNYRFAPGRTVAEAEAELLALVAGDAEVEFLDRSPSAPVVLEHPLVEKLRAAGVTSVEPKQAWTDVARFGLYGVPAVNLGPGTQSQAHQRNEWTDRVALAEGLELFRRFLFAP